MTRGVGPNNQRSAAEAPADGGSGSPRRRRSRSARTARRRRSTHRETYLPCELRCSPRRLTDRALSLGQGAQLNTRLWILSDRRRRQGRFSPGSTADSWSRSRTTSVLLPSNSLEATDFVGAPVASSTWKLWINLSISRILSVYDLATEYRL